MLRTLPLTVVKIDRSFVENVARSAQDAVLVRMVIETAHTLGLQVCAEGIEDEAQARQLVALGCDTAQGWYFGMPEPPSERLTRALRATVGPDMFDAAAAAPIPLGSADELVIVTTGGRIITYASSTSSALVGWTPQQLVGTSLLDHLHPDSVAQIASLDPGALHDGHATHRVHHRDGTDRWLEARTTALRHDDGTIREVISVCHDISAATNAQDDLADSEDKFRFAFDDSPTGMVLSELDGRIFRVNAAFATMIGRTADDLLGSTIEAITHPDDRAHDRTNLRELTDGIATVHQLTKRHLHQDGSLVPVHVRASVARDRAGHSAFVIAHVTYA